MTNLKIDWASHQAAKFSVENWHYSGSLPPNPLVKVGAWENGQFIGCVIFSRGANRHLGKPFGLSQTECSELTRVALDDHVSPVSQIMAIAIRKLRKQSPGVKLLVSFADPFEGHHGGIYQAGNWLYVGRSDPSHKYKAPDGKLWHPRLISETGTKRAFGKIRKVWKPSECEKIEVPGKHRYVLILDKRDKELAGLVDKMKQPYPKN